MEEVEQLKRRQAGWQIGEVARCRLHAIAALGLGFVGIVLTSESWKERRVGVVCSGGRKGYLLSLRGASIYLDAGCF